MSEDITNSVKVVANSVNVIAVTFENDSNAYEALTTLKELESQGQIGIRGAAVVSRDETGSVLDKDEVGGDSHVGTATGGIVGLLIGILGGPFGVLIGGATGLLIGSLFDSSDADDTESVLAQISKSIRVGHNALLAEVSEQSPEVIDTAMTPLGGIRPQASFRRRGGRDRGCRARPAGGKTQGSQGAAPRTPREARSPDPREAGGADGKAAPAPEGHDPNGLTRARETVKLEPLSGSHGGGR